MCNGQLSGAEGGFVGVFLFVFVFFCGVGVFFGMFCLFVLNLKPGQQQNTQRTPIQVQATTYYAAGD